MSETFFDKYLEAPEDEAEMLRQHLDYLENRAIRDEMTDAEIGAKIQHYRSRQQAALDDYEYGIEQDAINRLQAIKQGVFV